MPETEEITEVKAPAKINLCLLVGPRRADGYHPVCSLMEKVGIFDTLRLHRPEGGGTSITGTDIPAPGNTVYRAVRELEAAAGRPLPVAIELIKEIPVAAGLGGGSADAAAALELVVSRFGPGISRERLAEIALRIGADVPFFLEPGPRLAEGAGEALSPVGALPAYALVLAVPPVAVATADVYRQYDSDGAADAASFWRQSRELRERLRNIDSARSLAAVLQNDLEPAALKFCPEVAGIREELAALGALGTLMSGSGPAVFGIFPGREAASAAAAAIRSSRLKVWVAAPHRVALSPRRVRLTD